MIERIIFWWGAAMLGVLAAIGLVVVADAVWEAME